MLGAEVNRLIGRMPAANGAGAGVTMPRIDDRIGSRPNRLASTRYSLIPARPRIHDRFRNDPGMNQGRFGS